MLTMQMTGLENVRKALKDVPQSTEKRIITAGVTSAADGLRMARSLSRVRTGRMRGANNVRQLLPGGDIAWWEIYNPVEYAIYQDLGTRFMSGTHFLEHGLWEAHAKFIQRLGRIASAIGGRISQ